MKRISSRLTFFYKVIFPLASGGFLVWAIVQAWWAGVWERAPFFMLLPVAILIFMLVLYRHFAWNLADQVHDCGHFLRVRKGATTTSIALSKIRSVTFDAGSSPMRIRLDLISPSVFGRSIVFTPMRNLDFHWFRDNPLATQIARDLDRRVVKTNSDRIRDELLAFKPRND